MVSRKLRGCAGIIRDLGPGISMDIWNERPLPSGKHTKTMENHHF